MDDAAVGAEIVVAQLREAVEAEPLDDERVEMADEEVGEIEGSGLLLGERLEGALRRRRRRSNARRRSASRLPPRARGRALRRCRNRHRGRGSRRRTRGSRGSFPASPRESARGGCAGSQAGTRGRSSRSFSARISRASAPQAMTSTFRGPAARMARFGVVIPVIARRRQHRRRPSGRGPPLRGGDNLRLSARGHALLTPARAPAASPAGGLSRVLAVSTATAASRQ